MITMTETQWDELKARIWMLDEIGIRLAGHVSYDQAKAANDARSDLNAAIAEVDDANTRARYMALAADDQLGLFDGAPE